MKVETYGRKMTGLKAAAGATKILYPYGPLAGNIMYHLSSGKVWVDVDTAGTWAVYGDPDVRFIKQACKAMTMQEIADAVDEKVSEIEEDAACMAQFI